jgi:hypothetical protein
VIVALAGSGEFLPSMAGVDRELLRLAPGNRVAILPTAAGLEDPAAWGRMGVSHFDSLGARAIHVALHHREDAFDPQVVNALAASDLFYLSGGQPDHLVETLDGSPAWDVISSRLAAGAAVAGCSAGAMALAGWSVRVAAIPTARTPCCFGTVKAGACAGLGAWSTCAASWCFAPRPACHCPRRYLPSQREGLQRLTSARFALNRPALNLRRADADHSQPVDPLD